MWCIRRCVCFMLELAYMVIVLCTESVVCDLAFHTSMTDSHVAHPSFFPLQMSMTISRISGRSGIFGMIVILFWFHDLFS